MADDALKAELASRLARSRRLFARNLSALREDLDVPAHLKRNFTNHSTAWIGGAAVAGWILSRFRGRSGGARHMETKNAEKKRPSLLPGVAKLLFAAARPALAAMAAKKISSFTSDRS